MMLRYSFKLEAEATAIEAAVEKTLSDGILTCDLAKQGQPFASTEEMGNLVVSHVKRD